MLCCISSISNLELSGKVFAVLTCEAVENAFVVLYELSKDAGMKQDRASKTVNFCAFDQ